MMRNRARRRPAATLLMLTLFVAGCAGNKVLDRADLEVQRGNLDTAIAYYQKILLEDPGNTDAKIKLTLTKLDASQQHERLGVELVASGQYRLAVAELHLAVRLDPGNQMAVRELGKAMELWAQQERDDAAELTPVERALRDAQESEPVVPRLVPQATGPISFDFRDVTIKEIYRTLAQVAGLNVLFEPSLVEATTTFQVEDTEFDEALRVLTVSNGHFIKVLSPSTFMVVPDDVTKRREYADQVMRTFYLSNADAATIEQLIRAILSTSLVSSNPDLNTITVRDTPEAMSVIEKLISSADKSVGEILLEVEILEVSSEVVANYGLALEPFGGRVQVYPQVVDETTGEIIGRSFEALASGLTSADLFVTIPSLFYQFLRTTTDFKLIANTKLRAREGEETTLLIGEQVPVVTTTFNPQATVGGNIVPVSSTEYRDTGILLSVLPRIHFNGEITLEIQIQVSAVTATANIRSVGELPIFTTRQVSGSIRLKDGETNVIAGLLQDNDIRRRRGIIGLDNVPGLGDVLSDTEDTRRQTDIVISITPHIIRAPEITADDMRAVYVGTQTAVTGAAFRVAPSARAVAAGAGASPPTEPATLALLPAEHVVLIDEEFAIDVTVNTPSELFSAGFQLQFNPQHIAYVDYFEGGFLDRDGAEITVQATGGGPGVVRIGMSRMGSETGISGGGSLVTLVFRAVGAGTSQIEISSAALRAPLGAPIAVQMAAAHAQVTVRERE